MRGAVLLIQLGSVFNLMPKVNFATRSGFGNVSWGPRTIPDSQFVYVVEGEMELLLNRKNYHVLPGQCVFYGPGSPHYLRIVKEAIFYSVHFSWSDPSPEPVHPAHRIENCTFGDLEAECGPNSYELEIPSCGSVIIPHWFDAPGLEQLFLRIVKEYQLEKPGYPFMLRGLLTELIATLAQQLADKSLSRAATRIEPALAAMRRDPEQEWSIEQLARLCGYHPTHFTKLFKEETGRTPKHYIISEKIKRAKQLLLGGESIEAISSKLNYNNVHYFSHQFKKETGLNPSEYRQQGSSEEYRGFPSPDSL
jgi:AraC-like DNA-binding protein